MSYIHIRDYHLLVVSWYLDIYIINNRPEREYKLGCQICNVFITYITFDRIHTS